VKLLYHHFDGEAFLNSFVTRLQSVTTANCGISLRLKQCLIFAKSMNAFKFISSLCPQEKSRTWSFVICINIAIHSPSNRTECYSIRLLYHSYRSPSILHRAYGCRPFLLYNFCPSTFYNLMKETSEKIFRVPVSEVFVWYASLEMRNLTFLHWITTFKYRTHYFIRIYNPCHFYDLSTRKYVKTGSVAK